MQWISTVNLQKSSTRLQKYIITNKHQRRNSIPVNQLASLSPRGISIILKFNTAWIFEPPDKDPILADYVSGPLITIQDAFDLSITY